MQLDTRNLKEGYYGTAEFFTVDFPYMFPPMMSPPLTANTMNALFVIKAFSEDKNLVLSVDADSLGGEGG